MMDKKTAIYSPAQKHLSYAHQNARYRSNENDSVCSQHGPPPPHSLNSKRIPYLATIRSLSEYFCDFRFVYNKTEYVRFMIWNGIHTGSMFGMSKLPISFLIFNAAQNHWMIIAMMNPLHKVRNLCLGCRNCHTALVRLLPNKSKTNRFHLNITELS